MAQTYAVGDLVFGPVKIDPADIVIIGKPGDTTKAAQKGLDVIRICVVLAVGATDLTVTYTATFKEQKTLPGSLDKEMWYPFLPAPKEGDYAPLPAMANNAYQWASLRKKQTFPIANVQKKLPETLPAGSVALITSAMKA